MKRTITKKILAILMVITILAADFFVLGSNLITYAAQLSSETNNSNIEFSVYFKDGENKVDSTQTSIKNENLKLYAEIKVKNEGYLKEGAIIEIENSNFNLKEEILPSNTHIVSIEGNVVTLKQVTTGETVEIELGIEPIIAENITTDFLSKTSNVKMNGTYIYSQEESGEAITTQKSVCVNYQPDETTGAELETDIITNKVLAVNGTNKRIVQVLVKSRLTNNEYPVQQTTLNVGIPQLSETTPEVKVLSTGKLATNWTTENGTVKITLNNNADANNQINWSKNVYDEAVVTYIYPETVDASTIEITTNSEIKLYNSANTYTATNTKGITNQELSNVIIGKTEITTGEMYKGKIYSNIDQEYNTKTSIIVTNTNIVDEIVVKDGNDTFGTEESELATNTKYLTTEINLEKMLVILGTDGNVQIKNGETTTVINKDTQVNGNGNVVINHANLANEIEITTSKPVVEGVLEINHTKVITGNSYSRAQLQTVKTLKAKNTLNGTITVEEQKQNIVEKSTETSVELKETITKAEMTIDKTTLSTTVENEVNVGIKLITEGANYDLFKNPTFKLQLPLAVANVEFIDEPSKLYADEFSAINQNYDKTSNVVTVSLTGEQTAYPETALTQTYIQVSMKITLAEQATSQTDKITMTYTNQNASEYDGGTTGVIEQAIEISAQAGLWKMFNLSENENTSVTEKILERIESTDAGKEFKFDIKLINNNDTSMNNVKILGKLPTAGNTITEEDINTLETTLKNISAENATIYYTENVNATTDVENTENGWTTELSTLTNAKLYLIKLDSIARGETYTATFTVQMSNPITENALSYTEYEVIYDTAIETNVKENSRKIGFASSISGSIKVETMAQVGQDILNNGDLVKEGEIIKYTVTVKNNGTETLENLQLNLDVPNGTVYIEPIITKLADDRTHMEIGGDSYDEGYCLEITDSEKLKKLTTISISTLDAGQSYSINYQVRVNKGTTGNEIINKSTVIYNESTIKCEEFKYMVEEANIRVAIKKAMDESEPILPNTEVRYAIYVENLSNTTIKDLEIDIIAEGIILLNREDYTEVSTKINISELPPKENEEDMMCIGLCGLVLSDVEEMKISAIVKDAEGKKYRANMQSVELPKLEATISMSSPQNEKYVKDGDLVEYNIIIKNTGNAKTVLNIIDKVPEYLEVQSMSINKEIKLQKTEENDISNSINYALSMEPQEQAQIDIIAKVGYIAEMHHMKTITNMVTLKGVNVKENSQVVTHILKANTKQEESGNIISGFAWLDLSPNGQRDTYEETLDGVKVKLYNTLESHYVTDEYGNVIQIETNSKGEYNFTNIENGSYLIIFEYDTEKYEFTTSYAEGVDTTLNSKVSLKQIETDESIIRVAGIEVNDLNNNVLNMNIGLKENTGNTPIEEQPGITNKTENPDNPENPDQTEEQKTISGFAWLDSDRDGQKDENETTLEGIKVSLYDITKNNYLKDNNGNNVEARTDANGKYTFTNIEKGSYILIFEYDTNEYEPTTYFAQGVDTNKNSKVVLKNININGQEKLVAVTDTINVQDNVSNINIGLKEKLIFDLELNKYISRVIVQNSKETKAYDYDEKSLAKVEINKKRLPGSLVIIEYTIKVKNNGEIAGNVKNIVDYLPSGLTFSSELNKDWYLLDNNLYTKSFENVELKPGEEKEIKLLLTKTMTNQNTGLINNRAEIYQDYNTYGEADIDSTPNNQVQNEDDMSSADVIIGIATGGRNITYIILLMVNAILIGVAISIMIKNDIIKVSTKREGR